MMAGMIDRARLWYVALSKREQWLVAAAAALAIVTLLWGSAVLLGGALQSAHSRYTDAVRRYADTEQRVAAVREETKSGIVAPHGPIDVVIRDKAQAAGFVLSSNVPQADGSVVIAIASARPPALFAWVASLERDGLIVRQLAASNNGDQTLAVQMTLGKRGS